MQKNGKRSVTHAIAAVCHLAMADKGVLVKGEAIANESKTPHEYTLKIMQKLAKAGIVTGKRGPNGGFQLVRPANKITMLELIEIIDGPTDMNIDPSTSRPCVACANAAYATAMAKSVAHLKRVRVSDLIGAK